MTIVNDLRRVPVAPIAAPPVGEWVEDSSFGGTRIHRVTDAAAEGVPGVGIVPMYTNTQPWNADESLMILYEQKRGWRLHLGQPPFTFVQYLNFTDPPAQPEVVHWSTSKIHELTYLGVSGRVYRVDPLGLQEVYRIPKAPSQSVLMESHARPSWDDRIWGFGTWTDDSRTDKRLIVVDLVAGKELMNLSYAQIGGNPVTDKGTAGIPMISPDGQRCVVFSQPTGRFYVLSLNPLKYLRVLPADWTFEHQTFGKVSLPQYNFEQDFYYSKTQGSTKNYLPGLSPAYLLLSNLEVGVVPPSLGYEVAWTSQTLKYAKGPDGTFPFQYPTGVHLTAIAYRDPNWIWLSMMPPAKGGYVYGGEPLECFQQELWRVNLVTSTLERVCHHRSAALAMNNLNEYWQEPHPAVSPSGRFCLFGSDWSFSLPEGQRASKVDSWVAEVGLTQSDATIRMEGL